MNGVEPINQNMGSAISFLHPIAILNKLDKQQAVYFDIENGKAITGFRRQAGRWGVVFVMAQYGRGVDVSISPTDHMRYNGTYDYKTGAYTETNEGLPGQDTENGAEVFHHETAMKYIQQVKESVAFQYEVDLSPNAIHRFVTQLHEATGYVVSNPSWDDQKINFHFTAGFPKGHGQAEAAHVNGKIVMICQFNINGVEKVIESYVDKNSTIPEKMIQPGRIYLIKPMPLNKETRERTCNVMRTYKKGIRIGTQLFERGLKRPFRTYYDVTKSADNNVKKTMDHKFMPDQDEKLIAGAPMLTFDLDVIQALMKMFKGYPRITMKFKDPSSGVYIFAKGPDEYRPDVEVVMSPTIQFNNGRVWTP